MHNAIKTDTSLSKVQSESRRDQEKGGEMDSQEEV